MQKLSRTKYQRNEIKLVLSFAKIGLIIGSSTVSQASVLIGGDILNGNLNAGSADGDTTDDNFQSTPDWVNVGGVGTMQCTRTNLASPDGTRNAVLSLSGDRNFGSEFGPNGYTISAGDVFDIQYEWRDAFNWNDALDNVAVTLFTTDDDTINGNATPLVVDLSGLSTTNNTYETVNHDAIYTATADDVGKKLFLVFAGQSGEGSDTNGFARFDNLVVEVNPSSTGSLIITDIQYAPETAEVTLTWPKTNSSFYRVKYSTDLVDWSSELDDEVLSDRDEKPEDPSQITVTFPLSKGIADQKYLFFRVEE
jgi:hypothetical protein|tara:strand:+ start:2753 stop:3679 length:927 start_codon:yes stop_codon:yes gene_type:complete